MNRNLKTRTLAALAVAIVASLAFAGSASAKLVGEFTNFQYCPRANPEVKKCLHSITEGGTVTLGSKTVPVTNDAVLQGGFGAANKETRISKFFAPTEGKPTLQPVAQPVPGGLAGLVKCPEITNFILRAACEWTFENSVTGLNSTLELAGPASNIEISETNMARKEKVALKLPVKVHLENPFLGSNCYIASDSSPMIWNLTSGTTAPPPPNTPISGAAGTTEFTEEGLILKLNGNRLVDNAFAAPKTTGCGGLLSFLLDPIVSANAGLPAAAGKNTAILDNTVRIATVAAVNFIDESNP